MKKTITSNPLFSLSAYFGTLLALFLLSDFAFAGAQTLGGVAAQVTESMSNLAKLISAASYVAGVGFALMGMLKFKAHKDQPQQVPLSQPIVLLCISAGLIFLPSFIKTAGQTLFKGGQASNAEGTGGEKLGN